MGGGRQGGGEGVGGWIRGERVGGCHKGLCLCTKVVPMPTKVCAYADESIRVYIYIYMYTCSKRGLGFGEECRG